MLVADQKHRFCVAESVHRKIQTFWPTFNGRQSLGTVDTEHPSVEAIISSLV